MTIRDPEPGDIIGDRYRLEKQVGEGGQGVVFRAVHIHADFPCAIKLFVPPRKRDDSAEKRFMREATVANRVRRGAHLHPNVVFIFDAGYDHALDMQYLAMEWLQGETLQDRLKRAPDNRISPKEASEILLPLLDALAFAHEASIVHRDIKPANIFLAEEPDGHMTPKLLDFGVAILPDHRFTEDNAILGTSYYIAPETWEGPHKTTPSSDIWSIGVLLFEMIMGRRPFNGANPHAMFYQIITGAVPDMKRQTTLPMQAIINRALGQKPTERWSTVAELALALQQASSVARPSAGPINVAQDWSEEIFLGEVRRQSREVLELWFEGGEWERSLRYLQLVQPIPLGALRIKDGASLWNSTSGLPGIETLEFLEVWDVEDQDLIPAFSKHLCFPRLVAFDLRPKPGHALTSHGLNAIAEAEFPALADLFLYRFTLDADAIECLSRWIPQLHNLTIKHCRLDAENLWALINKLQNSSVRTFELTGYPLDDEQILQIRKILPKRMQVKLSRGSRSDESCASLCGQGTRLILL